MVGALDLVSDGEVPIPCRAVYVSRPLSVLLMLWPHRLHIAQGIKGHISLIHPWDCISHSASLQGS
jgi:hypothetical protein